MSQHTITKIAAITDDGGSISQHFGKAQYYLVITLEDGQITQRELRNKIGHNQFKDQSHTDEHHEKFHGVNAASHHKHIQMAESIIDCSVVLCGGMGRGAYESMKSLGIQPVITDFALIDDAISAYQANQLIDHVEKLH